jgi:hypothetical protein
MIAVLTHRTGELCLDKDFVLIEGHPRPWRFGQNDISLEIQQRVPPLRASRSGRDDNKKNKGG